MGEGQGSIDVATRHHEMCKGEDMLPNQREAAYQRNRTSTKLAKNLKIVHFNIDVLRNADLEHIMDSLWEQNIHIAILVGSRKLGKSLGKSHVKDGKYFHFYSGADKPGPFYYEGISILVTTKWGLAEAVREERPFSPRLLQLRIKHPQIDIMVTGAYAVAWTKSFGKGKKYKTKDDFDKARAEFWDSVHSAFAWGGAPERVTHIVGIDANGRVGINDAGLAGPGVGPLHKEQQDYNGSRLVDIMGTHSLCALNTFTCSSLPGTWFHAQKKTWQRIDYLLGSAHLVTNDMIRSLTVVPVRGLAGGNRIDHCPITACLNVCLSERYRRLKPDIKRFDKKRLANEHLRGLFSLTIEAEIEAFSLAGATWDLWEAGLLAEDQLNYVAEGSDTAALRSAWLEMTLQHWGEYFYGLDKELPHAGTGDQGLDFRGEFSAATREIIEDLATKRHRMVQLARMEGIRNTRSAARIIDLVHEKVDHKECHDNFERVKRHYGIEKEPVRGPDSPFSHWVIGMRRQNQFKPVTIAPTPTPGQSQLPVQDVWSHFKPSSASLEGLRELGKLAEEVKLLTASRRKATRRDYEAKVERITERVELATTPVERERAAQVLMQKRKKWGPQGGSTTWQTQEDEVANLRTHMAEEPRNCTAAPPPPTLAQQIANERRAVDVIGERNEVAEAQARAQLFDTKGVKQAIKKEKTGKACLRGTVPIDVVKTSVGAEPRGHVLLVFMSVMYAMAAFSATLPTSALDSSAILIPKPGAALTTMVDLVRVTNYHGFRVICLLHRIWTIFSGVVAQFLMNFASERDSDLFGNSFGGLPGRSKSHMLVALRSTIEYLLYKKVSFILLSLDIMKAFDALDRDRFSEVLQGLGVPLGWTVLVGALHGGSPCGGQAGAGRPGGAPGPGGIAGNVFPSGASPTVYEFQIGAEKVRLKVPRGVRQGSRE